MGFEVFTALEILLLVFWVVTPCGLAGRQRFGATYCFHLQGNESDIFLKNVGSYEQVHTASEPRRPPSTKKHLGSL
jgi:hypothetical protein